MWETFREPFIPVLTKAPGLPQDTCACLSFVDEICQNDAYHSLSIEGCRVTAELIERVRKGLWDRFASSASCQSRDALAARGYCQALQRVRKTVSKVIGGADAGEPVRMAHGDWFREMFQPPSPRDQLELQPLPNTGTMPGSRANRGTYRPVGSVA